MANSNGAVAMSLEEAKILVMEGQKGDPGESPRINPENNHWEVYDNDTEQWVDTGVNARGPKGDPGSGEGGGSLPEVDSSDIGKVLRVNSYAEWDVLDPPVGVPDYSTADVGSVLKIYRSNPSSANSMTWGEAPTGLPDVSASDNGKILVCNGESWVASSMQKEVVFLRHCVLADEDVQIEAHTIQRYVDDAWRNVNGEQIYSMINGGTYPIIMDAAFSYPRVFKPEQTLLGTNVVFRATGLNGTADILVVPWGSSVANAYTKEADLPETNALADVGKVPTVMSSGGYGLQYPEPFEIPITDDTTTSPTTYSTTASVEDIIAHRKNLVATFHNLLYTYDGYATSGVFDPTGDKNGTFYFSSREISNGVEYISSVKIEVHVNGAVSSKLVTINNYTNTLS